MSHDCKGNHRWPRLPDMRSSRSIGVREIWTCNDCMATKVVFTKVLCAPDGAITEERKEDIVEPVQPSTL